jgi:LysM repeat protein
MNPETSVPSKQVMIASDTLRAIAKANGVTVEAILAANPNMNPAKIRPGEKIMIPPRSPKPLTVPGTNGPIQPGQAKQASPQ